jgi:hypothetical protein
MTHKTSNFQDWLVTEVSDDDKELHALGLGELDFEDRWDSMIEEWIDDAQIQAAIETLKSRTTALRDKWLNLEDSEDSEQYDQQMEWRYEQSVDDLGWLEYTLIVERW